MFCLLAPMIHANRREPRKELDYDFLVCRYLHLYFTLYNNQINARALIGQPAGGYYAGKPTEKLRASAKLLYKSKPLPRGLRIVLVLYQHPAWFI